MLDTVYVKFGENAKLGSEIVHTLSAPCRSTPFARCSFRLWNVA
jgi:hypothetical protein